MPGAYFSVHQVWPLSTVSFQSMRNTQPDVILQYYSFSKSAKVTDYLLCIVGGALRNGKNVNPESLNSVL